MDKDSLLRRVFRRRTGPEKAAANKPEVQVESEEPKLPERALGLQATRRQLLGAAAATMAGGVPQNMLPSVGPVAQIGVPEAAALLAPRSANVYDLTRAIIGEVYKRPERRKNVGTIEEAFTRGVPLADSVIDLN